MKSAAAALGPAASYLCAPEAHGNAPCRGRWPMEWGWGGTAASGGLRGKTRGGKTEAEKKGEGK